MEVKINIEAGQIGDTVIDLFKNLSSEKKEELALSVMREWLQNPEFFETKNKEQLLVEEFRKGVRKPQWGRDTYNNETPEHVIRADEKYKQAVKEYKNSKQIMVEELKKEIVGYYKEYISKQIADHELINQIKEETYKEIVELFPSIITQVMINTFSNNLSNLQHQIQDASRQSNLALNMTENVKQRLNL